MVACSTRQSKRRPSSIASTCIVARVSLVTLVINVLAEAAEVWENLTGGSSGGMPDRDVTTIRDLIYYQYAKIIARSAFSVPALHTVPRSAPSLLEKQYLKTIYNCHACADTLDRGGIDGDHDLTVLDIDFIIG